MTSGVVALCLLLCGLAGQAAFFSRRRVAKGVLRHGGPLGVSIIIPARNEEKNLPKLLSSLRASPDAEVLVVDDDSQDATSETARRFGARVIASAPLPAGWTGKNWACQQGAHAANSEILCFVDADVEFRDAGLESIVEVFRARGGSSVISVLPFARVHRPFEQLSAFFNILMAMGTGAFAARWKDAARDKLVGQCLVISRETYFGIGGHEAVKGEILENFFLSARLRGAGVDCRTYLGEGVLDVRMFPEGFAQLREGWSKAFVRGSGQTSPGILILAVIWLIGVTSTIPFLILARDGLSLFTAVFFGAQIALFNERVGSFALFSAIFYPVPLVFYHVIFFKALLRRRLRRPVSWRGREIPCDGTPPRGGSPAEGPRP